MSIQCRTNTNASFFCTLHFLFLVDNFFLSLSLHSQFHCCRNLCFHGTWTIPMPVFGCPNFPLYTLRHTNTHAKKITTNNKVHQLSTVSHLFREFMLSTVVICCYCFNLPFTYYQSLFTLFRIFLFRLRLRKQHFRISCT